MSPTEPHRRLASPFSAKLGTNYCPTDEEIVVMRSLLSDPSLTLRLNALDDEIAVLQKRLDALNADRDDLVAYVESHNALLSPVRRLPLDIIQEIFVACLPDRNCLMSATEAPVLLGRICSSWRAISLSTPRLWSKLHIVEPRDVTSSSGKEKWARRLDTSALWLARSGTCVVSISVASRANSYDASAENMHQLFSQILIPLAPRWRAVYLNVLSGTIQLLSNLTEDDVPAHQQVSIIEPPTPGSPDSVSLASMRIFHGPSVSWFSFMGPAVNLPTELPLRWNQLTVLHLIPLAAGAESPVLSARAAREILSVCRVLRVCHLGVRDREEPSLPILDDIIEHTSLHTFHLRGAWDGTVTFTMRQLFARLSLPGLREFRLTGVNSLQPEDPMRYLTPFLAAAPFLESLQVSGDIFSQNVLIDFLRGLRALERLTLDHSSYLTDEFLDQLAGPEPRCPDLRAIVAKDCAFSDAAVLRFITSRMTARDGNRLEQFELYFGYDMLVTSRLDVRAGIQPLVDAGHTPPVLRLDYPAPRPEPILLPLDGLESLP
ncbi:hypothetical protein FB45DRAFT_923710 [Roridomyces roridus]|uniref:F-box domain-containing protein n=1 Tax=Roridomyces roridus TaxID=1738132 RepID=A0AAD7BLP9_9AGAR|nr:hypothetical protein FB45DRAFT_923710 [Roridomyces roridus]